MQTGLAEVVMTTITSALPMGLTKVATTATRAALYDSPGLSLMNKAVYDKLSPQHRDALLRAYARHASSVYRAEVRGFENTLYGMHEKAGGQIATMTADQRATWRKQLEAVYPQIVKETGGESEKFFATMEAGRKACAK